MSEIPPPTPLQLFCMLSTVMHNKHEHLSKNPTPLLPPAGCTGALGPKNPSSSDHSAHTRVGQELHKNRVLGLPIQNVRALHALREAADAAVNL